MVMGMGRFFGDGVLRAFGGGAECSCGDAADCSLGGGDGTFWRRGVLMAGCYRYVVWRSMGSGLADRDFLLCEQLDVVNLSTTTRPEVRPVPSLLSFCFLSFHVF